MRYGFTTLSQMTSSGRQSSSAPGPVIEPDDPVPKPVTDAGPPLGEFAGFTSRLPLDSDDNVD